MNKVEIEILRLGNFTHLSSGNATDLSGALALIMPPFDTEKHDLMLREFHECGSTVYVDHEAGLLFRFRKVGHVMGDAFSSPATLS